PEDVFIGQFQKMADGFREAQSRLKELTAGVELTANQAKKLQLELDTAEVCSLHFQSVANQSRFVQLRDRLLSSSEAKEQSKIISEILKVLESEKQVAIRLHEIQSRESRFGFEATNHYFYIPIDLAEKVLNVVDLIGKYSR
ncbi:MAG: hypothetical protein KC944_20010, partial [Candidatus Omnitrophica bacterium]|nr:hypothetical protein [Candidatus Omnitrophota bacterium]